MYRYLFYGFHVESELKIDEVMVDTTDAPIDIKIKFGKLPDEVLELAKEKTDSDFLWSRAIDRLCFRIPNVADYYITTTEIQIRPIADIDNHDIITFLLGSAFGYLMTFRNVVVIHGGAITKNGKGIIVTGESGAGKSTVTNALRTRGYDFIADDVCVLSDNDKKMHINLAYPQAKLCRDAALKLGYDLSELIYINEDRDKFAVRLKDRYVPEGKDFDLLFEIVLAEDDKLSFAEIKGTEALKTIHENLYRANDLFKTTGVPPTFMMKCLKTASSVRVFRISRPKDGDTLEDILTFIENVVME